MTSTSAVGCQREVRDSTFKFGIQNEDYAMVFLFLAGRGVGWGHVHVS